MMELIQQLVSAAGVSEQQAEGGAGLLMGLVKDKLSSGDFSQIASALPGVENLIDKAPDTSRGLGGMLGGLASSFGGEELGNLASLASGFSKLDLDMGMIGKFIPVILQFAQSQGGDGIAALIGKVLLND